ncbi:MAG: hypothetical protein OEV43_08165 [Coriobacteriia bacterium]|nr:hypothetical protein [Coriobacteriia bacterium]
MSKQPVCNPDKIVFERIAARGLVIGGGVFWIIAAFAARFSFGGEGVVDSVGGAIYPFAAAVVVLAVGWFYERAAAVLLFAASIAVLVWGVLFAWEPTVWLVMTTVLVAPMTVSGIFFLLASRMERICALVGVPAATVDSAS